MVTDERFLAVDIRLRPTLQQSKFNTKKMTAALSDIGRMGDPGGYGAGCTKLLLPGIID